MSLKRWRFFAYHFILIHLGALSPNRIRRCSSACLIILLTQLLLSLDYFRPSTTVERP
jgi:hypothetical protein